jgi:gas vesicle protein
MKDRGIFYFSLGCAVGVLAAVLFTPKSGRESIEYISGKAKEGSDYIKQRMGEASEAVTGAVEKGKRAVRYQAENLRAAVHAGEQAYKTARETAHS